MPIPNLKVLCYHGPLLYEAKCVKSRKDTKSGNPGDFQYFVHYQGWNKNWDEWVDETRILKASSENFDKKEKLFLQHQVGNTFFWMSWLWPIHIFYSFTLDGCVNGLRHISINM